MSLLAALSREGGIWSQGNACLGVGDLVFYCLGCEQPTPEASVDADGLCPTCVSGMEQWV